MEGVGVCIVYIGKVGDGKDGGLKKQDSTTLYTEALNSCAPIG